MKDYIVFNKCLLFFMLSVSVFSNYGVTNRLDDEFPTSLADIIKIDKPQEEIDEYFLIYYLVEFGFYKRLKEEYLTDQEKKEIQDKIDERLHKSGELCKGKSVRLIRNIANQLYEDLMSDLISIKLSRI